VIEPEDLLISDTAAHRSEFAISALKVVNHTTLQSIASKLTELESTPVIGAFDANHLQQIHARIFQDTLPLAGQLREQRPSSLSTSLDNLFDRLAGENRLKGLELDAWSKRAAHYLREIELVNPFDQGSDIASAELFRELAMENGITLRWATTLEPPSEVELQMQAQKLQSENFRRLLILAVDPDLSNRKSIPGRELYNSLDLIPFP
jgi:cell filamentation protein